MKKTYLFLFLTILTISGQNASGIRPCPQKDPVLMYPTENLTTHDLKPHSCLLENENSYNKLQLAWNYKGAIGKFPIKAQINYSEEIINYNSGRSSIPITGYYFYVSQNTKIPIKGICYQNGSIQLVAYTVGGEESFEGTFTTSMLSDFSGTWSKGKKELNFYLTSVE